MATFDEKDLKNGISDSVVLSLRGLIEELGDKLESYWNEKPHNLIVGEKKLIHPDELRESAIMYEIYKLHFQARLAQTVVNIAQEVTKDAMSLPDE